MPGVSSVDVDVPSKSVTIAYDGEQTLARVESTLEEIGYPVAE
jgi:copper chaperone CopZ